MRGQQETAAHNLYTQGYSRKQVAEAVYQGNYNSAHSAYLRWKKANQQIQNITTLNAPATGAFVFTMNRKFGIEIEAYGVSRTELKRALEAAGIPVTIDTRTSQATSWKITTDGSINGTETFELVSPVLSGEQGLEDLKKVCQVLKRKNAKINKSCGLHVHVEVADFQVNDWKNLLINYLVLENEIDSFLPVSRRSNNNNFCKSLKLSTLEQAKTKIQNCSTLVDMQTQVYNNRYYKVNLHSYRKFRTVEFRHHAGSVEFEKISNWVLFVMRLTNFSKEKGIATGFSDFCNESLLAYIHERKAALAV